MTDQNELFGDLPIQLFPAEVRQSVPNKVWTEHKAQLIARYLRYFVFITKHGAYIDGFAGPKSKEVPNSWSAELVLDFEPRWMRDFFLCDLKPEKIDELNKLVHRQPKDTKPRRRYQVIEGDFNSKITDILESGWIKDKTATFCLLDQFTCQCEWSTVKQIAEYKTDGHNKIEMFYFLATSWLHKSLAGFTKQTHIPEAWWGRPDWRSLMDLSTVDIARAFEDRFKKELGYKYAVPWPIFAKEKGQGRPMFYMIHASDHDEAPKLMGRAYRNILQPLETEEQLSLEFMEGL